MIEEWDPNGPQLEDDLNALAEVLHASVHAGASIGFIEPFPLEEARAFWTDKVLPGARHGSRRVLVARIDGKIVGTVQLVVETLPSQRHRADVAKMMVHPKARRQGIARALMLELENIARSDGRTLLTLDTRTGDFAEPLYRSMGYVTVGVIPGYARALFRRPIWIPPR